MSVINEICLLASIFIVLNVLFTTSEASIFKAGITGNIIATVLSALLSFSIFMTMRKKQQGKSTTYNWATPYYFMLPAVLVLALVVAFPLIYGFYLSMTNMSLSSFRDPQLIWFNNYLAVFSDPKLISTLVRTVIWTVINVFFHVTIGLLLAIQLNRRLPGKAFFRLLLIIPWAIPQYVAIATWKGMFNESFGVINNLLQHVGVSPVAWLGNPTDTFIASIFTNIWLGFPFMMMIALGGLQSIPRDIYEAADIDGISAWKKFTHITVPLLKPVMVPAIVLGSVWTFNMVNVILIFAGNQGGDGSQILVTQVYRLAFSFYRYGFAAAYSVIIFILLLVFSLVIVRKSGVLKEGEL